MAWHVSGSRTPILSPARPHCCCISKCISSSCTRWGQHSSWCRVRSSILCGECTRVEWDECCSGKIDSSGMSRSGLEWEVKHRNHMKGSSICWQAQAPHSHWFIVVIIIIISCWNNLIFTDSNKLENIQRKSANLCHTLFIQSNFPRNYETILNYSDFKTLYSKRHLDALFLVNGFKNRPQKTLLFVLWTQLVSVCH